MTKFSQLTKSFALVVSVLAISLSLSHFVLAWTEPTVVPPSGNVATPLNVGATGQTKSGGLWLNTSGAVNGLIVDKGNVGIGTTNPQRKLHIVGGSNESNVVLDEATNTVDNNPDIFFRRSRGVVGGELNIAVGDSLGADVFYGYYGGAYREAASIHSFVESAAGTIVRANLSFRTTDAIGNEAERMRIDKDGNVGIGTTSPQAKLHIVPGEIYLENKSVGEYTDIHFNNTRTAAPLGKNYVLGNYGPDLVASRANKFFIRDNDTGLDRFIIDQSGNVGIGTSMPDTKLEVNGDLKLTPIPTFLRVCNAANTGVMYYDNSGALCICNGVAPYTKVSGVAAGSCL